MIIHQWIRNRYTILLLIVLLSALIFLPACSLFGEEEPEPVVTPTLIIPTPIVTPTSLVTLQATEPALPPTQPESLNVWFIQNVSPRSDLPGGTILAEQLTIFQGNNPDITLNVDVKSPTGQGSTLNYLRSGRNVAPSILPDLILLPVDQLATAAGEELIYPLNALVDPESVDELFPSADQMAQVGDQMYGYPYALSNLGHMANSSSIFTDTLPLTWDELLAYEDVTFAFPGAGISGAELALQFYLASGGTIVGEPGRPALEIEPLTAALTYFSRGRDDGLLPIETSNLTTLTEAWQTFNAGTTNTVQTMESLYGPGRESALDSGFSGIPGVEAPLVPLVNGWAWAISTPNPIRQAQAADLLHWLSAGPNVGDWSLAAGKLPARRDAFEQWPADDLYIRFVQDQLEIADPFPQSVNSTVLSALSTAVFEVVSLGMSPQAAAAEVISTLQS